MNINLELSKEEAADLLRCLEIEHEHAIDYVGSYPINIQRIRDRLTPLYNAKGGAVDASA